MAPLTPLFPLRLLLACFLLLSQAVVPVRAQSAATPVQKMMADGYYLREPTDRKWHLRFAGEVPSLAGAYVVVHDAKGKLLHHGLVPHGVHLAAKPFVVTFEPDGVTGDYKVVIIGYQNDYLGLQLPLSDLPFEVYGGTYFSMGHENLSPYFRAPRDVTTMALGAFKGSLRVLTPGGTVVADTAATGKPGKGLEASGFREDDNVIEFAVQPGEAYRLERKSMYFRSREPVYFAFDLKRWFEPTPELDKIKWWNLVPRR